MSAPNAPPSVNQAAGIAADPANPEIITNYVFEWNRTLANRVKKSLLAQKNDFERAVEARLSPNSSLQQSFSIQSRDFTHSN